MPRKKKMYKEHVQKMQQKCGFMICNHILDVSLTVVENEKKR